MVIFASSFFFFLPHWYVSSQKILLWSKNWDLSRLLATVGCYLMHSHRIKGHWIKELLRGVEWEVNDSWENVCIGRWRCVEFISRRQPSRGEPPWRDVAVRHRHCAWKDVSPRKRWCIHCPFPPRIVRRFNDCPAVTHHLWWSAQFGECFLWSGRLTLWGHVHY